MMLVQAVVQAAAPLPLRQVIDVQGANLLVQAVQAKTYSTHHTHPRARHAYKYVNAWTAWTSLISLAFSRSLPGPCLDHAWTSSCRLAPARRGRIDYSPLSSVGYVGGAA